MTSIPISPGRPVAAKPVAPYVYKDPSTDILEKAGVGSVFEKTASGWKVKYVDGGTVINVSGPSIYSAMQSHGQQVVHPPVKR
jgi:hypothetical protein